MRRGFRPLIALTLILATSAAMATDGWLTDYKAALKKSKASGKPILANFTGSDWCPPCKLLHKEVFETKEFKTWAKKSVILLEIDFPQKKKLSEAQLKKNIELERTYQVLGYPTILFLKSDGSKFGRSGYLPGGAAKWIKQAQEIIKPKKRN